MNAAKELAARFFAAIERGDIEAVRACYAPDARIWHNTDPLESPGQTVEENLRTLGWVVGNLRDIRYEVVRREATETGFVQQHVLRAIIAKSGAPYAMPAAIVCEVTGGRIARLEEYLDSAHVTPLTGA